MDYDSYHELGWRTDISSLANQARFGIRYFSGGRRDEETTEFLQKGVGLCEILLRSAEIGQKKKILPSELNYSKISSPLKEFSKNLENIEIDSRKILGLFNLMIGGKILSEEETDYVNNFLVSISEVYQRLSWKIFSSLCRGEITH